MQKTNHQIGHTIIHLLTISSTNNYIAKLIKQHEITHGTVVMADYQTEGRGQRGTIWHASPKENLTCSIYVEYPHLAIEQQASIHHWISLGICKLLKNIGLPAQIKWPNDILIDNKKIAGILIENSIAQQTIKSSIVGIGLNVNQQHFEQLKACSLYSLTNQIYNIQHIALSLMEQLNIGFMDLTNARFHDLRKEYHQNLWNIDQQVTFLRNDKKETGILRGTDQVGQLQIQTLKGIEHFEVKEIKFLY